MRPAVTFVVESGTDVRLVEGLADICDLEIIARRIDGAKEISQPHRARITVTVGPKGHAAFARFAFGHLRRRNGSDVILVQGYGVAALAANLAARLAGVPSVMLVCSPIEQYYECRRVDPTRRAYRRIDALAIRMLAWLNARVGRHYVVLSPYLASVVRGHGTRAPVDVIPVYGVDTGIFAPSDDDDRTGLRRRLGLPLDSSLIFFSSRIAPEKDPDVLLDAVAQLRSKGRDLRIVHLSGGYREFRARADKRGLGDAVIVRDAIPPFTTLADWYRATDLCVQASRAEGLGFSPLEALACGVPVVASAVGGLRDTIVEPETGWSYEPGDPAALARAIEAALSDPQEARRRALRGRALVERRYGREAAFASLARLVISLAFPPPAETGNRARLSTDEAR